MALDTVVAAGHLVGLAAFDAPSQRPPTIAHTSAQPATLDSEESTVQRSRLAPADPFVASDLVDDFSVLGAGQRVVPAVVAGPDMTHPSFTITLRLGCLTAIVSAHTVRRPTMVNPCLSSVGAPSVAYPCPQCRRASRHPASARARPLGHRPIW